MKKITINNSELNILAGYEETSFDGQEKNSLAFKRESSTSFVIVIIKEINEDNIMPFNNNKIIVDSIHDFLHSNQGLVEVKNGTSKQYSPYVYSIVKTVEDDGSCQYNLTLQIKLKTGIINIAGFGQELDNFGSRETAVFNMLNNSKKVSASTLKHWNEDPFDSRYTKGKLKNYSENKEFDGKFLNHPLSVLRRFADSIIDNN